MNAFVNIIATTLPAHFAAFERARQAMLIEWGRIVPLMSESEARDQTLSTGNAMRTMFLGSDDHG